MVEQMNLKNENTVTPDFAARSLLMLQRHEDSNENSPTATPSSCSDSSHHHREFIHRVDSHMSHDSNNSSDEDPNSSVCFVRYTRVCPNCHCVRDVQAFKSPDVATCDVCLDRIRADSNPLWQGLIAAANSDLAQSFGPGNRPQKSTYTAHPTMGYLKGDQTNLGELEEPYQYLDEQNSFKVNMGYSADGISIKQEEQHQLQIMRSESPPPVNHNQVDVRSAISHEPCINCKTLKSPLWRRDLQGNCLCNACGLYHKAHGTHRPLKRAMGSFVRTSASHPMGPMSCSNCGTENTTLWRRNDQNMVVCNACGLYEKLHKRSRPIGLTKTNVIKKRKRKSKSLKPLLPIKIQPALRCLAPAVTYGPSPSA
eukprot:CFRG4656T1